MNSLFSGGSQSRAVLRTAAKLEEGSVERLRPFALVCLQLALLLLVVYRFDIAAKEHFFPVLCLAVAGFTVHAWLPHGLRSGFFVLLSLAGILFVLGWPNGAWVMGLGGGLIVLCRLPVPLLIRILLLLVAGVLLATYRVQIPAGFWPVLGSMFMFRLILYVYETRREGGRAPLGHTLAYFFPLPNVCFPFFPILDFKTFRTTYYDAEEYAIYQTGVAWMVRGITHLLLYRFIKYYLVPSPTELRDLPHVVLFLVTNYALYLHISGWFHLITGLLHLFGFNLPRTMDNYFLASSFSDIWRRINIYWKDFMMKLFFFPAFFSLRCWGTSLALAGAVLWVFVATWLLHAYQMFWLTGNLPLGRNDAILWLAVGVLVAVNVQIDLRRATKAAQVPAKGPYTAAGPSGQRPFTLAGAVGLSLRIVGMFTLVSFFWACWTVPGFVSYLRIPARFGGRWGVGALEVLGVVLGVVAVGVLVQWVRDLLFRLQFLPWTWTFPRSVAVQACGLGLLLVAGIPQVAGVFGPSAEELVATLRLDGYTPVEASQLARNYYEQITENHVQAGSLLTALSGKDDLAGADLTHYLDMTRPGDALMEREPIPGWKGKLAGSAVSINSFGMRDRDDITLQKPPNTCRIGLIGSSVVLGYGVADDEVFKVLLEKQLNDSRPADAPHYELLNFGAGMSDAIYRRVLIERKVLGFQPDALYYFAHQEELIYPPRHLAKLVARGVPLPYPSLEDVVRRADLPPHLAESLIERRLMPFGRDILLGLYRGLVEDCRQRGILPVWVYLPIPGVIQISTRSAELVSLASEAGFQVVDLSKWSEGYKPEELKPSPRDYHLNALGHHVIAERMFAVIRARRELLPER
jgi:hypothetical protein